MTRCIVLMAATVVLAAPGVCAAEAASAPSGSDAAMVQQARDSAAQAAQYSRWAALLSGLALATALWVGYSMRTLARNDVAIARLIDELKSR